MLENTVRSRTPWRASSRWYRSIIFYGTYSTKGKVDDIVQLSSTGPILLKVQ